jgi:predicted DNA-binding ribbon-helix-helix protein
VTSNTISAGERVRRNVTVSGRRTSVSLEVAMWEALRELCERERLTPAELFTLVDQKRDEASLASALRIFALTYFRLLAGWRAADKSARAASQPHSPIFQDVVGEFERGRMSYRRKR